MQPLRLSANKSKVPNRSDRIALSSKPINDNSSFRNSDSNQKGLFGEISLGAWPLRYSEKHISTQRRL